MTQTKRVYFFGGDVAEGKGIGKEILGGKGAGLQSMVALGIPVPPGFTIPTDVCNAYFAAKRRMPAGVMEEARAAMARIEALMDARFGDAQNPLLVSVRSGARASMPGMMDTILNLGLNETTCAGLAARTGNRRFALDCYRRFVSMFGDVVLGLKPASERDPDPFEEILEEKKKERKIERDLDLTADDLADLVVRFKEAVKRRTGQPFPDDPWEQLQRAITSVFDSWNNPRAETYRRIYGYPASWGTASTVQAMVFGNMGEDCATGVAFTRDPASGEKRLFGEFLPNAQGEDVVAGIRTPLTIEELSSKFPNARKELDAISERLERSSRDMQDIEFTVQRGKLWMLQTRNGKRSGRAMVRIAVELVKEGLIDKREAILRVEPGKLEELLHPTIDPQASRKVIGKGLPASPGAAIGKIAFTANDAEAMAEKGEAVILVRVETSPEDIHGMKAAQGILTSRGGMTSHAAVVARGMGKPCVVGAGNVNVDPRAGKLTAGSLVLKAGDVITIDGSSGDVMAGTMPLTPAKVGGELAELMTWIDEVRRLRVRTNADTPVDAKTARAFGAEGIGLCRTEHMFFEPARILAVRRMMLAPDVAGRREALATILPMQRGDFEELFREMDGLPVTIRLLDPPLHEFLPKSDAEIEEVARAAGMPVEAVRRLNSDLHEANPMLGHRGCRLAVTYPEIYETQVRAIAEAALAVAGEGKRVFPEIMIPIVGLESEITSMRKLVEETFQRTLDAAGREIPFSVGTMIELPRACVTADKIAAHADFFSFGTNDLTQTTFGFSRDDIGSFLPAYIEQGLLAHDPFVVLDREGVGALIATAVTKGRSVKPRLKIGICGEHGGEPSSVEFCDAHGLDYVSCSPFRIPIARVAAAQAVLRRGNPTT
jgi:pyruvate,orthophosphate dikinase